MLNYTLPVNAEVNGTIYDIRSDYRAILDICCACADPELLDTERAITALTIFYPEFETMPYSDREEATNKMFEFIALGETKKTNKKEPKLIDWEQDFSIMISAINNVAGKEIRALEYLHWWTFIGLYNEIDGECLFAQVVNIRSKRAHGKPLDKQERSFYNKNRDIIEFQQRYTDDENELLEKWLKV